jgi:hypothetical protein
VDVSTNGGIIRVNQKPPSSYPSVYTFSSGTKVYLEAIPAFGYRFSNWAGDLPGTIDPTIILIDCNKNITANFSANWLLMSKIIGPLALVGLLVFVLIKRPDTIPPNMT